MNTTIRVSAVAACLLLVVGCGFGPELPAEQIIGADALPRVNGCADVVVYATSADDTLALIITWRDAASQAQTDGGWNGTASLPQSDVRVMLQFGRHLSEGLCTDVVLPDRPVVQLELPAESGEVQLEVRPEPGAESFMPLGRATVTLRDVVFQVPVESGATQTWRVGLLELRDVQVGWFAG